jgi:hypothetical protein
VLSITDPSHPLYSVGIKLSRAGDQIKSLTGEIAAFLKSNPYVIEIQGDQQAEHLLGVARIKQSCPPVWSSIIGEIAHNLRCALDYFVFQLVVLETGTTPPESAKIQFPIFLTEPGFNNRGVPTMLKGVGVDARALIKALSLEEPVTACGLNVGITLDIIGRNVATVCKRLNLQNLSFCYFH